MLAPVRLVVPLPAWVNDPVPVITCALRSVVWSKALLRLMVKLPLLEILVVPVSDPVVAPSPSCRVPALIVVAPV